MNKYIVTAFQDGSVEFEKKFDNATSALTYVGKHIQFDREHGLLNYYYQIEEVREE